MVTFYMDVHVPAAVTRQLRNRKVDVLTAQDDNTTTFPDDELLYRATELNRIMVTRDIRFKAFAEQLQRDGTHFAGLVFAHQLRATIGQLVEDLELIAFATDPEDWEGMVEELPLK